MHDIAVEQCLDQLARTLYNNAEAAMKLLMPFIVRTLTAGQAHEEEVQFQGEVERLCEQARAEMQAQGFRSVWLLLSSVGQKPQQGA